jgi:hypothetical protein
MLFSNVNKRKLHKICPSQLMTNCSPENNSSNSLLSSWMKTFHGNLIISMFVIRFRSQYGCVIYRARFNLSPSTKLSLYYPYLNYCSIVWSSTYVTNLQRILILQKRIVRLLTNSVFSAHTAPLFNKLKVLLQRIFGPSFF